MQYPTEVPGVSLQRRARPRRSSPPAATSADVRRRWSRPRPPASASTTRFLDRPLNVDLSGGEKKRNETLQLGVLAPEDRHPRRARLGPRRRRPARLRPPDRGRPPTRRGSACWPSPTTAGCSTSCARTSCTCSPRAASRRPGGPELADRARTHRLRRLRRRRRRREADAGPRPARRSLRATPSAGSR